MALLSALRIGSELQSAAAWKNAQVLASFITAVAGLAAALGYDLKLSDETITGGAVFIVAIVNGLLAVVTSKKVGLPAKQEIDSAVPVDNHLDFPGHNDSESGLGHSNQTNLVSTNQPTSSLAVETNRRPVVVCSSGQHCNVAGRVRQPVSSDSKPSDLSAVGAESNPVSPVVTGWGDRD